MAMDNLMWGLQTTALGMGLVFGLLALLWGLLTMVLRLDAPPASAAANAKPGAPPSSVTRAQPAAEPEIAQASAPATVQGMDAQLIAAITVATLAHRAVQRREAAPVTRSYWPGSLLHASRWLAAGRARQIQPFHRRGRE